VQLNVLAQPFGSTVGDRIIAELAGGNWDEFRCAVAFAKLSGVQYVDGPLRAFTSGGSRAVVSVGVDLGGTSFEAASQLAGAIRENGELIITKDVAAPPATFHPKAYLFRRFDGSGATTDGLVICGSSNLTEGGLFTNHEFSTAWVPDLADPTQRAQFEAAVQAIVAWQDVTSGLAVAGTKAKLLELLLGGLLPTEVAIAAARSAANASASGGTGKPSKIPSGLKKVARPGKPAHTKAMGPRNSQDLWIGVSRDLLITTL
jgi:HKD family nuclease